MRKNSEEVRTQGAAVTGGLAHTNPSWFYLQHHRLSWGVLMGILDCSLLSDSAVLAE
jgi:hypothetical protein